MNRLPALLASASLLVCVAIALSASRLRASTSDQIAQLERRLDEVRAGAVDASGSSAEANRLALELQRLTARLDRLEEARLRTPIAAPDESTARVAAASDEPASAPPARAPQGRRSASDEERAEFATLLSKMLEGDFVLEDTGEAERFWKLARETDVVDAELARLEERLARSPEDVDLRMELADGYIAKLATVPGGPEQGLWGMKAEEQWREVLKRDPDHWRAQFSLADGWSHYPDFMGKTGDAIAGLERAREIQEQLVPLAEHVQTYLSLARMYTRSGKQDRALETLEAGLAFHPGDERLLQAIEELR